LPICRDYRRKGSLVVLWQGTLPGSRRRKSRHGIDQILHIAVNQGLRTIGGLELLDMIGGAEIPVFDCCLVG
jgi:hypothetical protein